MAIYHFSRSGISPANGSSAVAASAYISGETLKRERTGRELSYARSERVVRTGVRIPKGAPQRFSDREVLWNEAERAYGGGTELTAHRDNMALPRELGGDEAALAEIMDDYAKRVVAETGHAVEWAIHSEEGGNGNWHAHVLESALPLGKDGFERPRSRKTTKAYLCRKDGEDFFVTADDWREAKDAGYEKVYNFKDGKRRTMSEAKALGLGAADRRSKTPVAKTMTADGRLARVAGSDELKERRALWADCVNSALEKAGLDERVDHRSYKDAGNWREPTSHLGYRASAIERRARRDAEEKGAAYEPVTRIGRENEEAFWRNIADNLRDLCRIATERAQNIYEWREMLDGWGVDTDFKGGLIYVTDRDAADRSYTVTDLAPELDADGLKGAFRANSHRATHEAGERARAAQAEREREEARVADLKKSYLGRIEKAYLDYRKQAHAMKGADLEGFPKLKLPRPPQEVADDPEVRRTILAYWRGADELRAAMASGVVKPKLSGRPSVAQQQETRLRVPERGPERGSQSHER